MPSIEQTIMNIVSAPTWDQRVARVRQIPALHGTDDHVGAQDAPDEGAVLVVLDLPPRAFRCQPGLDGIWPGELGRW